MERSNVQNAIKSAVDVVDTELTPCLIDEGLGLDLESIALGL